MKLHVVLSFLKVLLLIDSINMNKTLKFYQQSIYFYNTMIDAIRLKIIIYVDKLTYHYDSFFWIFDFQILLYDSYAIFI